MAQTHFQGTTRAVIPQSTYFWKGDLPRRFLSAHGGTLKARAKTGKVSVNTCICIAALIEDRKVFVYGDKDCLIAATLDRVKDAVVEARLWAEKNPNSLVRVPSHFNLGAFIGKNDIFEELDGNRPDIYARKMKLWDDKVVSNGFSVGWYEYWKKWDYKSAAPDQNAVFAAAATRVANSEILAGMANYTDSDEDSDIPNDAYSRLRNKKRVHNAAFGDSTELTPEQVAAYLAKMAVFVENDIAKDPNLPSTDQNHAQSDKLRKKHEKYFYKYFKEFMKARNTMLANIAAEEAVESLAYEECPERFHILDHYSAAKLIEFVVWAGLKLEPLRFRVFFDVSDEKLVTVINKMAIESHKAQVKKKYIKDGARLKSFATLRGKVLQSFKLVGGAIRRVKVPSASVAIDGRFDVFDVCLPQSPTAPPKKKRKKSKKDEDDGMEDDDSDTKHGTHKPATVTHPGPDLTALHDKMNLILGKIASQEQEQPGNNVYSAHSNKAVEEMRNARERGARHYSNEFVITKKLKAFRVIRRGIAEYKQSSPKLELYANIMSNDLKNKAKVSAMQGLWGKPFIPIDFFQCKELAWVIYVFYTFMNANLGTNMQ